jgi:hypothetical protein
VPWVQNPPASGPLTWKLTEQAITSPTVTGVLTLVKIAFTFSSILLALSE